MASVGLSTGSGRAAPSRRRPPPRQRRQKIIVVVLWSGSSGSWPTSPDMLKVVEGTKTPPRSIAARTRPAGHLRRRRTSCGRCDRPCRRSVLGPAQARVIRLPRRRQRRPGADPFAVARDARSAPAPSAVGAPCRRRSSSEARRQIARRGTAGSSSWRRSRRARAGVGSEFAASAGRTASAPSRCSTRRTGARCAGLLGRLHRPLQDLGRGLRRPAASIASGTRRRTSAN